MDTDQKWQRDNMDKITDGLYELKILIDHHWQFSNANYKRLNSVINKDDIHMNINLLIFNMNHVTLHNMKTLGKITSLVEKLDHNPHFYNNEFRKNLANLITEGIINYLQLANINSISSTQIVDEVVKWLDNAPNHSNKE